MTKAKKLIEVAMPIKEISAESVRDKSIRHGHISTLHLWWARRPLPVCRAVIFASLVPDPLDEQCPQAFKDAIQELLGNDPLYAPYPDIPYTAIYDPMPDNLRNRLLMFIGKFSPVCQANMLKGKNTASKEQLSEGCLIKWESKNDKVVLTKARKLIWVAYNAGQNPNASFISLSQSFDAAYQAIEEAENNLYSCIDRHLETDIIKELAIISETNSGKLYTSSSKNEYIKPQSENIDKPTDRMAVENNRNFNTPGWGIEIYGDMFSDRQLFMLQSFTKSFSLLKKRIELTQYTQALYTYLAIWIDRIAVANTSLGRWHNGRETIEHPFSRQAIAMVFDYPESNPFCSSSGSATNQLEWILRYIESESNSSFCTNLKNASSGERSQFGGKQLTAVVTDPPYYDAIAYADISDFFYVWLKRTLNDTYPLNFSTPQTPKSEECTALKHHHNNSEQEAKLYFEKKLTDIFDAIEQQTSDIVSIMFAHQTTEAWTTLCNSILSARMNITGSWPMDTEMANRSLGLASAALESSVTVSCRPSERSGYGSFKQVKRAIEEKVNKEVEKLYGLGFRGADLLTACFGQAVSEFGKYEKVEKADGSEVTVTELLELAKTAAFNALLRGFEGDEYTKFYIGWLQMNGMEETDFDDAAKFTRIGMNIDVSDIFHHHLLIKDGNKQHLASYTERITGEIQGTNINDPLIDQVQQAMMLWSKENRPKLLRLIKLVGSEANNSFWRVLASLKELLPDGDDLKQVNELLANSEELIQSCQKDITGQATQMNLGF